MAAPPIADALLLLPQVLQTLTQASLESFVETLLECSDGDQDAFLAEQYQNISCLCAQIQLDSDKLNPKWNKAYGEGGTNWQRSLEDGRSRGNMPYYCPKGWVRFSLNVCKDAEFEEKYGNWGYLYHGTKGKFVGAILTSGFQASSHGAFLGAGDSALYTSPSIEYSGHPRYAGIEYNPESRQWIQVVLQCRVNPKVVWKKERETLGAERHSIQIDPNVANSEVEWLLKANYTDPATSYKYIKDGIVCTAIMMRVTQKHPLDIDYWWTKENYSIGVPAMLRVDPSQSKDCRVGWKPFQSAELTTFATEGDPLSPAFKMIPKAEIIGKVAMGPLPFACGGMRCAYLLETTKGIFVAKDYLPETRRHILDGLKLSLDHAIFKEVATYLVAAHYAREFNANIPEGNQNWKVEFVEPCVLKFGGMTYFVERYVEGKFLKWNNNAGDLNMQKDAIANSMADLVASFCHFTYHKSGGCAMVVDIQGWDKETHALFTDPQVHTRAFRGRSVDRRDQILYQRFSLGNFGRAGMVKFFSSHKCGSLCKHLRLANPFGHNFAPAERVAKRAKK